MLILYLCVIASSFMMGLSQLTTMGNGIWSLVNIAKCDRQLDSEAIIVDIKRSRINRTHDGISAKLDVALIIDDSYGILIDVCKFVDGGCKQYQIISDDSIINLIDKYAKENVIRAFELAKIDPPEFPVYEGNYVIEDFIMDYCELPTNCVFGKFEAEVYLVNNEGEKVACLKVVIVFDAPEDDEELC
ncbi:uncharacterized protein LOC120624857 [Pararge aegeria]|uniref:Jg6393 protein n=1 Tax=Pararge aegeria aegeria TaxID=348720 RepID=A0A8S4RPV3_9NEOP|nr:uncharacterized protein LOC120624857 [Pararge aegeria]CAH2240140.1 jg6393 [Pararge aegeria aegeria]